MFGLFNKLFYTYDALMWYGLWGMALVLFRHVSPSKLFAWLLGFYLLGEILPRFDFGDMIFADDLNFRYMTGIDLGQVVGYPLWQSMTNYLSNVLNGSVVGTFTYFLLGYWLAKAGVIDNLQEYISKVNVKRWLMIAALAFTCLALYYGISYTTGVRLPLRRVGNISLSLFYVVTFLSIYYRLDGCGFKYLEAYGKLGLTNYSVQSIFGVIVTCCYIIPNGYYFNTLLILVLLFYILQCVFSYMWLKYFKYGPFEYLWRSLANFKFTSPLL